jgi:intein/homing endonuclease
MYLYMIIKFSYTYKYKIQTFLTYMKSILISSDFVHDSAGNLKLLEINTNSGIVPTQFPFFDFSDLKAHLLNNGFTKLVFVYNNNLNYFVEYLQNDWNADESVSGITLELVKVFDTFYGIPSDVIDNSETFIIRSVYDSTAIVDSEFCANEINLYDLFINNNDTGSIPNLKFKRDDSTEFDNLDRTPNSQSNIPDYFLKKSVFSPYVNNKLVKLENGVTIDDLITQDNTILDTYIVENYHYNEDDSLYNNKIQAVRAYQLWYGSNLDCIDLGFVDSSALTVVPSVTDFSVTNNFVDKKWRYSYVSNFLTTHDGPKQHGYRENSLVELEDGNTKELKDVVVGDVVKSYIITSLPDAAVNTYNWFDWKQTKADYDSLNKYETTSSVVQIDAVQLNDFSVELTLENDIVYNSLFGSGILTWQSGSNTVQFISATVVAPGDRIITSTGNGLLVQDMNVIYDTGSYYSFDVEESDTIILKPADIIVHNYECFAAGTKVILADGSSKNIEDVQSGDVVVSHNLSTNVDENKVVGRLLSILSDHISYVTLSNGTILKVTNDHPIYSNNGWAAIDVELTKTKYEFHVTELNIGDLVKTTNEYVEVINIETKTEPTMVFTLKDVEDNANFYADGVLVHNRPMIGSCFIAGTKVTMADGSEKNIEDIVIGDEVISLNENELSLEPKKVIGLKTPIHNDMVKYVFANQTEIVCTFDHPFYVGDLELASYTPFLTNKRYELNKEVRQIKGGDMVYLSNGVSKTAVKDIIELDEKDTQTYIITVEDNHNFYANGILVHNK